MCRLIRQEFLKVANEYTQNTYSNYKTAKEASDTINTKVFTGFNALRPTRIPEKGTYTLKVNEVEVNKSADLFNESIEEKERFDSVKELDTQESEEYTKVEDRLYRFLESVGVKVMSFDSYAKRFPEDVSKLENTKGFVHKLGKIIALKDTKDYNTLLEEVGHIGFHFYTNDKIKNEILKYIEYTEEYKNNNQVIRNRYKAKNPNFSKSKLERVVKEEIAGQIVGKRLSGKPVTGLSNSMNNWFSQIRRWINKFFNNTDVINSIDNLVLDITGNNSSQFKAKGFTTEFYSDDITGVERKLTRHLEALKKRKSELERRIGSTGSTATIKRLSKTIAELNADLEEMDWIKALSTSVKYMLEDTDNAVSYLKEKSDNKELPSAEQLLNIRQYLAYYKPFTNEVDSIIKYDFKGELEAIGGVSEELKAQYSEFKSKFEDVQEYHDHLLSETTKKNLLDNGIPERDINNILHKAKDIQGISYWIQPARFSSDAFIRVVHKILKNVFNKVHRETMDFGQDLVKLADELGITSTTKFYELDQDGKRTGYFLTKYNNRKFNEELAKKQDELHDKYNLSDDYHVRQQQKHQLETHDPIILKDYNKEWAEWFSVNSQKNPRAEELLKAAEETLSKERFEEFKDRYVKQSTRGVYYRGPLAVPASKYESLEYNNLSEEEKIFLDKLLEEKFKIDLKLPVYTEHNKAPQITQSFTDLLVNRPNDFTGSMKDIVTDGFVRKIDDTQFGEVKETRPDESVVRKVPIFFTRTLQDTNLISTDAISSIIAYKKMQSNFTNMSSKIPELENLTEYTRKREVFKSTSNEKVIGGNSFKKMENVVEMYAYGVRKHKFEVAGIDVTKIMEKLAKFTSSVNLIGSFYTSASNFISAATFSKMENIIEQFSSKESVKRANLYLAKHLPSAVLETGKVRSENPMTVLMKYIGLKGDAHRLYDNVDKNTLLRVIKDRGAWASYEAPDYIIKAKVMLSIGYEYGVKDGVLSKDSEVKLIDLLSVKDGKLDFSKIGVEALDQFTNLVQAQISNVTGELSDLDKAAAHQNVIGQLMTVHKGWFFNNLYRRLGKRGYNEMTGVMDEGYWLTIGKSIKSIYDNKEINKLKAMSLVWNDLQSWEKANVKRGLLENAGVLIFALTAYLLNNAAEDDEELMHIAYIANKSLLEVQALANPYFAIAETTQIAGNPFTVYRTFENMQDAIDIIVGNDVIERGKYKGFTERERAIYQLTPGLKGLSSLRDPKGANQFLKNKPLSWLY